MKTAYFFLEKLQEIAPKELKNKFSPDKADETYEGLVSTLEDINLEEMTGLVDISNFH